MQKGDFYMNSRNDFALSPKVSAYVDYAARLSETHRGKRVVTSDYLLAALLLEGDNDLEEVLATHYSICFTLEDILFSKLLHKEYMCNYLEYNDNNSFYSDEAYTIMKEAQEYSNNLGLTEIDISCLIIALVQTDNPVWELLYEMDDLEISEVREMFNTDYFDIATSEDAIVSNNESETVEPQRQRLENQQKFTQNGLDISMLKKLSFDLTFEDLNLKFSKEEPLRIRGRDDEIEKIFNSFQKMSIKNVMLIGKAGVGKTSIVEGVAERIVKGLCPKEFKDMRVLELNVDGFMNETSFLGQREEKQSELKEFLYKNPNVILFIDEIHIIIGLGRTMSSAYDFSNFLKPLLTSGKVRIIGSTTDEEYDEWFEHESALKRRFETIMVKEPKIKELYKMLGGTIDKLEHYHGVKVSRKAFNNAVAEASYNDYEVANPARTVNLLDNAMVIAKNSNKGNLDYDSIRKVYKENYKMFKKMPKDILRSVAYHEAGHYIIGQLLFNDVKEIVYVTIIPCVNKTLGETFWEYNEIPDFSGSKTDYENSIMTSLAGRAAEELKGYENNAGAIVDYQDASMLARRMLLGFSLGSSICTGVSKYSCYTIDEELSWEILSEAHKNQLNKSVELMLENCDKKAKKILQEHEKQLDRIAEALLKKGHLNKEELDKLFNYSEDEKKQGDIN